MKSLEEWATEHAANNQDPMKAAEALLVTILSVPALRNEFINRFGLSKCLALIAEATLGPEEAMLYDAPVIRRGRVVAASSTAETSYIGDIKSTRH